MNQFILITCKNCGNHFSGNYYNIAVSVLKRIVLLGMNWRIIVHLFGCHDLFLNHQISQCRTIQ